MNVCNFKGTLATHTAFLLKVGGGHCGLSATEWWRKGSEHQRRQSWRNKI